LGAAVVLIVLAARAAGLLRSGGWRRRRILCDPVFGVALDPEALRGAWEALLDGLSLPPESPIRAHIRQLFARPEVDDQLRELFDELCAKGSDRMTLADFERFSRGIHGHLHVLLDANAKVRLVDVKATEMAWMGGHFAEMFPPEKPLNRARFPALAKLILLRRVVRTLVEHVGLEQLQEGMPRPLVVEVVVQLGPSRPPFRLHTITPKSTRVPSSGESLGPISEDEGL